MIQRTFWTSYIWKSWFNCCQQLPNWARIEILNDSITWIDHPIHCRVRLCKLISPAGTYSIDVFNAKIKKTTLIQKQDSNIPKTSGMKLIVSEHVTIVASSIQFDGLNLLSTAQNGLQKSTLDSGFYQTSTDTSLPQKLWSRHYRQINRVKNKTDRQPSSVLMYMQVSDNKTIFTSIHLVFLELDAYHSHSDFKLLGESNNTIVPETFYL